MTRTIVIANQKGGVGKTTTAINLGDALARRGNKVLLIDCDPQANATAGLGISVGDRPSTYDLLLGDASLSDVTMPTGFDRLSIVPATSDLAGAEVELTAVMARESRMTQALEGGIEAYDIVIIDCPPSVGLLTINALTAADEVIVPVQCEYLALEGLGQFTSTLELVRRNLNQKLRMRGPLLTMYDRRTTLSQQVADEVRSHFPETFQTVIARSVRLGEAPSHGLPIHAYDPRSPASAAYDALAEEVLGTVTTVAEVIT
ncbi:MAG: ParA family protein [Chloroflexi bacterium]|nr:ParA family protein [Chloroflexota bacterium]